MHIRISNEATPRDVNSTVPACPLEKISLADGLPRTKSIVWSDLKNSKQLGSAGLVWYARMIDLKGLETLKVRHRYGKESFMLR